MSAEQFENYLFKMFVTFNGNYELFQNSADYAYDIVVNTVKAINTPIELPEDLKYEEKGLVVHSLLIKEYITLLANLISDLKQQIKDLNISLQSVENDIDTVNTRIDNLDIPEPITVVSGCLSDVTPGVVKDIDEAFETLEENICNYLALLGTMSDWVASLSRICNNLSTDNQLANSEKYMSELTGWQHTVLTVADSYNNLWLTICDLRQAVKDILNKDIIICEKLNLTMFDIVDKTTVSCKAIWDYYTSDHVESPLQVIIDIYEGNDLITTISALAEDKEILISHPSLNAYKEYIVKARAIYSCGSSESVIWKGYLLTPLVLRKIKIEDELVSQDTEICEDNEMHQMDVLTRKTTLTLIDNEGDPIVADENIFVKLKYIISHPVYGNITSEKTFLIKVDEFKTEFEYRALGPEKIDGVCQYVSMSLSCGISINKPYYDFDNIVKC